MSINSSEELDDLKLITKSEGVTLFLALLDGAGGAMEVEQADAALENVLDWAEKTRLEYTALEAVLRGKVMLRCEPDGEIVFISKNAEHGESLESIETDRRLS